MDEQKLKHIEYWKKSAEENFKSMQNIFLSGEYMWSLFIGHLALEKYLKAVFVKNVDINVPRIHDLYKLSLKSNLSMS